MVGGPLTVTKARMERYTYTLPIADATDALLKRASDTSLKQSSDISGKTVGAGKGSAQLDQLKAYIATLPKPPEVREYVDNNQAYADLAAGRIVAVANSMTNIAYVAKQRPDTFAVVQPPFGAKVYFAYCMRKDADSKPLADAFNAALIKMHNDGRLAALQKKWFGVAMDAPTTHAHAELLTHCRVSDANAICAWRRSPRHVLAGARHMFSIHCLSSRLCRCCCTRRIATVGISLTGLVIGFFVAIGVCAARLSAHRAGAHVRRRLCVLLSRRADARAVAAGVLPAALRRHQRVAARRGDQRGVAVLRVVYRRDSARRLPQHSARTDRSGAHARHCRRSTCCAAFRCRRRFA